MLDIMVTDGCDLQISDLRINFLTGEIPPPFASEWTRGPIGSLRVLAQR